MGPAVKNGLLSLKRRRDTLPLSVIVVMVRQGPFGRRIVVELREDQRQDPSGPIGTMSYRVADPNCSNTCRDSIIFTGLMGRNVRDTRT
jgi:hypothetical protein